MRRTRKLSGCLLLALAAGAGCSRERQISASSLPPELKVPDGATRLSARRDERATAVQYVLSVPYPADAFLTEIGDRMKAGSWTPAESDLLNPSIPSSHVRGWTSYIDNRVKPRLGVHQWLADWRNREGDVVSYSLQYSSPCRDEDVKPPPPASNQLHVTAFLIPAREAKAFADQARKPGSR